MPSNLIENRTIRVFISSTFRDMQDERDELMKKTFPVLRRKAAERDVTLTELDLRWGITPEESESGRVVEICLREIENSTPFFVGIIGNRYGWIPSPGDLGESLRERFSQVDGYVERHLSVTEMEMQFGVLERPEELHAYFFIKERETDDADEPEKLAALKAAVRSNGRYPVSTYSSPEDLANQVEAAFTKLLDVLYPEGALSELEKERVGQRAYLNSLCQNHIRTDANFAAIDGWMADWERHQLVIIGASGLGKSALVANWVKEKLAEGEGLPYRIIYHFVGNGGSLGSHGHVIKALCDEIRDRYGFDADDKEDKTDEKELETLFNRVAAEGDKPLLIVLDAINQIIDVDNSKQLNWLPIPPRKVKILFTTLEDDRTMEVFRNRHYPIFTLQPLTKAQREDMVKGYLGLYAKKLQPHQIERIVTDSQCENTLVLKTLLDELVNFGIFERLDEKIGTYLDTESVEEFYGILLRGYEADFGEPLVRHILSLIAVSRNGLSEEEILSITRKTPLHWSQFFCAIRQHLIVKNGLVSFAHSYIRRAVDERYLQGNNDWENACRKEIVAYFNGVKTHRAMDEVPYQYDKLGDLESLHDYLMDLEVFTYLKKKEENTLGGYWRKLISDKEYSVAEYLPLVENINDDKKAKTLTDLSGFTRKTVVDPTLSLAFIEKALPFVKNEEERADALNSLGLSYDLLGNYIKALDNMEKALEIGLSLHGENHPDVAAFLGNVGSTYGELGDYKKALEYQMKSLKISMSLVGDNHPDVARSYNNIGSAYRELGDSQKALEYMEKALKIGVSLFGEDHPDVVVYYGNIGGTYEDLGDYNQALEYNEKALKISLTLFGENHPDVATSFANVGWTYGKLGNLSKALEYEQRSIILRQSLFGENHPDVASSYNLVGDTYDSLGDYQKSLEYKKKALTIRLSLFGENHPSTATSYNNVGLSYVHLGDHKKGLEYEEKALNIRLSLFGENHPDVASSYNNVGVTYGNLGDNRRALEYEEKALRIWLSLFGENHPNVANTYSSVGATYGYLGDHQKALVFLEKALTIRLSLFGENHPSVATSYNNVGLTYGSLGNHKKALEYEEKALKIRLALFGENHPDVATSYYSVGSTYGSLGDHKKALECKEKALKSYLSLFGENHPSVATSYNNVGLTYGSLGNHKKALEYEEKALKIRLALFGENHPDVASSYNNVGVTYGNLGDNRRALEYEEKALKIRLSLFGENHPSVATSYNNVGVTCGELGDHKKELEYEEKALNIRLSLFGENHPDVAQSYNNVGSTYGSLGEHMKALENKEKALKIRLSLMGENNLDVASSYNDVGGYYGELGDYEKESEFLSKALEINLSLYGEDCYEVARLYNNIGAAKGKLGNQENEIELRRKALDIAIRIGDANLTASLYNRVGRAYKSAGQQEIANDYFRQAAEKFRELGDEEQVEANLKEIVD